MSHFSEFARHMIKKHGVLDVGTLIASFRNHGNDVADRSSLVNELEDDNRLERNRRGEYGIKAEQVNGHD